MSTTDYVVDVIGFSAGVLLASSLLAQIWRAHVLESAVDLSYSWQGALAMGLFLQLIYLSYFEKWAVFVPLLAELLFMLYLICLKLFFEQHLFGLGRGRRGETGGVPKEGEGLLGGDGDYGSASDGGGGEGGGGRVGGNGRGAEAVGRNSGAGEGEASGLGYERLNGAENGHPTSFEGPDTAK